ncbi:MAG: hypothetical protein EA407_04670 [Rhodobacteraceae bacterium]|nr:MAG: hypothetical protein EA407_04670 [Paracoccaceae bacterium]
MHPVDYATGQLAFDAATIEGYYAVMIEAGTLDIYWRTQMIDFGFIASMIMLSLLLGTFLARLGGPESWGWRLGMGAAVLGVAGASMDVIENLLSFVMLANPQDIPQGLAFIYSSFAAAKFGLLILAMLAALGALAVGALERVAGAYRPR